MGRSRSGLVCIEQFEGGSCLCFPRYKGQKCSIHRCLQQEVGIQVSLDLSTPVVDPSGVSSSKSSQRLIHSDCSWDRVFWRSDLQSRAIDRPFQIRNLHHHLKDLTPQTNLTRIQHLRLEAWKVRGGQF